MTDQRQYIGRVVSVQSVNDGYRFALVEPILESSADGTRWVGRPVQPIDRFPERGLVFWHLPPASLKEDSYWQFGLISHPSYARRKHGESLQVEDPREPIRVLDLRTRGTESELRRLTTVVGVEVPGPPIATASFLWINDAHWLGPLDIVPTEENKWVIKSGENLVRVPVHKAAAAGVFVARLGADVLLVHPDYEIGEPLETCNWETDALLAKRVLKRIHKLDKTTFQKLGVTYNVFDSYIDIATASGLVGRALEDELGRVERIRALRETVQNNQKVLEAAVDACFESPSVQRQLEKEKERAFARILKEQKLAVDAELKSSRDSLKALDEDVRKRKETLKELTRRITEKRDELDEKVASFEEEFQTRLGEIAAQPQKYFAEFSILRNVLAPRDPVPRVAVRTRTKVSEASPPPQASVIDSKTLLWRMLGKKLMAEQINPILGQHLHSAFLSGATPILIGAQAYEVARTYAGTVCGARLLWVPVSGSVYEPTDLLGRYEATTREVVPHAAGILEKLVDSASAAMSLVLLDGFNMAAVESYLLPLLASRHDSWRGRVDRKIPVAPPDGAELGSTGLRVSSVQWPTNVLLALIGRPGGAALRLPADIWPHVALFDCDRYETTMDIDPTEQVCEVSGETFRGWTKEVSRSLPGSLEALLKASGASSPLRDSAQRLAGAAVSVGMNSDDVASLVLRTTLLPALVEGDASASAKSWVESSGVAWNEELELVVEAALKFKE